MVLRVLLVILIPLAAHAEASCTLASDQESQDEGPALWQAGFLDGVPRSPFILLAEAIQGRMPA